MHALLQALKGRAAPEAAEEELLRFARVAVDRPRWLSHVAGASMWALSIWRHAPPSMLSLGQTLLRSTHNSTGLCFFTRVTTGPATADAHTSNFWGRKIDGATGKL
jgi:hypothetical protein